MLDFDLRIFFIIRNINVEAELKQIMASTSKEWQVIKIQT